jgi:hypothetical protein
MWQYEMVSVDVEDTDDSMKFVHGFLKMQSEEGCQLEQIVPLQWVVEDEHYQVTKYLFVFKYPVDVINDDTKNTA